MKSAIRQLTLSAVLVAISALPMSALAASATAFASLDFISISTTGSATATLTGSPFDVFSALADTTAGAPDVGNDGAFFESFTGPFGEGTAVQGPGSATSFADVAIAPIGMAEGMATTFQELALELAGTGDVMIDIGYTLDVDIVDSLAEGFAEAGIIAFTTFEGPESAALAVAGGTPFDFDSDVGVLTIAFFFDDLGFGPVVDFLSVETFAVAKASAVPVPAAVWLMGSALLGLVGVKRRHGT